MSDPAFTSPPVPEFPSKLGQAVTYVDPNDISAGFLGSFKIVSANHFTENVSLCPNNSPSRIHSNSISFGPNCGTIYLTIPEIDYTLAEATLITRNKSYPSSVILNNVSRNVTWVGRDYSLNYATQTLVGDTCINTPDIELDSCWSIISFKIYHGNVSQSSNDVIVFAYLEGQTYLTNNTPIIPWHSWPFNLYYEGWKETMKSNEEYLSRCVVDPLKRTFYLYSNEGSERKVFCETVDQFMNVLEVVRSQVHEDFLSYSSPLWSH